MPSVALAFLAGLASSALSGCAYSTSRLVTEPGVSSIAIAQFDNKTYRRDLEFRLTQALAEEVRARTPWRIATPGAADVVLSGTIHVGETTVLSEKRDQARTPILVQYRLEADCVLTERQTGRPLRSWHVVDRQDFAPGTQGETLDGSATDAVTRSLAETIVMGLETPIGDPHYSALDPKKATPPRWYTVDPATRGPAANPSGSPAGTSGTPPGIPSGSTTGPAR